MKNRKFLFLLGFIWFFLGCFFLFWGANKLLFYGFILNEELFLLSHIPFEAAFFILISISFLLGNFFFNQVFKKVIQKSAKGIQEKQESLFFLDFPFFSFWLLTSLIIFIALLMRNFFDQYDVISIVDMFCGALFFRGSLLYLKSIFFAY